MRRDGRTLHPPIQHLFSICPKALRTLTRKAAITPRTPLSQAETKLGFAILLASSPLSAFGCSGTGAGTGSATVCGCRSLLMATGLALSACGNSCCRVMCSAFSLAGAGGLERRGEQCGEFVGRSRNPTPLDSFFRVRLRAKFQVRGGLAHHLAVDQYLVQRTADGHCVETKPVYLAWDAMGLLHNYAESFRSEKSIAAIPCPL